MSTVAAPFRRFGWRLMDLEELGTHFGTDKVDEWHTHVGLTNCAVYDLYLRGWRTKRFSLVEIGVLRGASLRMWQAYFPKARVRGLDIDPAADIPGLDVTIGSQGDEVVLAGLVDPDLRLVIDDGSHVNDLTINTFRYLFPRLPSGSIYIVEDTIPSYEPALAEWPGMTYNQGVSLENDRSTFDAFIADLMHDCDAHPAMVRRREGRASLADAERDRDVSFVHVWPGFVIIGRA